MLKKHLTKDLAFNPTGPLPVCFDILSRLGFFFYWIFDNIQILASVKFINADASYHMKLASWGWFIGIIFGIARHLFDLLVLFHQKKSTKSDNKEETKKIDFEIF